jgi:hypothetical protein
MSYPYDAPTLDAINRLATYYNGNNYNAGSNPGGFGVGGHRVNFIPSLQDLALVADSVADAADAASTFATNAATSETNAAASAGKLTGTSTTSVSIGTGAKSFTTQAGKSFDVGTFVEAVSAANPTTHYMSGQVTAYDSGTGALTVNVTVSSGSGSRSDWTIYGRTGSPGVTGATGATGAIGDTPAVQWNFGNGTADTDPGNGIFMFNNAALGSVTFAYLDNLDRNSASQTAFLDSWDDSTNVGNKGTLFFQQIGTTTYAIFQITGAVVDGTGYRKVPISHLTSNGSFTNGAAVAVGFVRAGDKGLDGAGAGDTISDISSATVGRIALYNNTDGKHITEASFGIGTSGANIGALSTANTWGGAQSYAAKVDLQQDWGISGDITPTQVTADQNDYAPTGHATAAVFRVSTDASRNFTGLAGGYDGRVVLWMNIGSFDHVFKNDDASSTAANRFAFGADHALAAGQSIWLIYDATATRWKPLGSIGFAAAGTVARPAYSFADDADTGIYRIGVNNLGLAVAGNRVADFSNPTGSVYQAAFPDGAMATPGIGFFSDPDCGLYRIGANNIGLAVNATKIVDIATTGITVIGAVAGDTIGGSLVATQSDQETGTSTTKAVSPGRQHFHPSACKGWVKTDASGTNDASYNVAAVSDTATGAMTVTWDVDFSSGNYVIVSDNLGTDQTTNVGTQAAGSTQIDSWDISSGGVLADPTKYFVAAFGDQA